MDDELYQKAREIADRADGPYMHHLLFARFLLGENLQDAAWMARDAVANNFHTPDVEEMVYIAKRWSFPLPPDKGVQSFAYGKFKE